jgi:hypothetical protein
MPPFHIIGISPEWPDSWEVEKAEQAHSELDNLVTEHGRRLEEHKLFWHLPKYKYEDFKQRSVKRLLWVCLFISACLFWALALELAGYCSQFRGTCRT